MMLEGIDLMHGILQMDIYLQMQAQVIFLWTEIIGFVSDILIQ